MIPNASKCSMCQSQEHTCRDCPSLYSPLTPGFYSGGGGGGGHSHNEDDEHICHHPTLRPTLCVGLEENDNTGHHLTFRPTLCVGFISNNPFYSHAFTSKKSDTNIRYVK